MHEYEIYRNHVADQVLRAALNLELPTGLVILYNPDNFVSNVIMGRSNFGLANKWYRQWIKDGVPLK